MGKGSDRAAKKHKKALKRKQKLRERSAQAPSLSTAAGRLLRSGLSWEDEARPNRPAWAWSAAFTLAAAEQIARTGHLLGEPFHPQIVAKLREYVGWTGRGWTIGKARAASTDELVGALAGAGVQVDPDSFRMAAAGHDSGWALTASWDLPPAEAQSLGIVACELWRRWCPDTPSMEMIEDAIQEGFARFEVGDEDRAGAIWLDAWGELLRRLPPAVRTFDEASAACPGLQSVENWVGDALMAVNNFAVGHPEHAERGLAWVRALRDRFTDGTAMFIEQEAMFLDMLHRHDEAEALLREWMAKDPDDPMPYAILADFLDRRPDGEIPTDPAAAVAVLEAAIRRPVRDLDAFGLRERLADLRGGSDR